MKWLKLFVHLLHCDLIVLNIFASLLMRQFGWFMKYEWMIFMLCWFKKVFIAWLGYLGVELLCGMLIWFDGIVWSIEFYAFPWVECFSEWTLSESSTWLIGFEFDVALMSYPIWFILIWSTSSWTVANLWPHLHRLLTFVDMCSLIMCSIAVDISTSANPHVVQTHTCFFTLNGVNVCCEHRFYIFWMFIWVFD